MKVLVISDTHRRLTNLEKVLGDIGPIDMLLHMGDAEKDEERIERMVDCPVYFVAGNCDYYSDNPSSRLIEIENHKIFMTHGHKFSVNYSPDLLLHEAKIKKAEVAFFGHIHMPVITEKDDIIIANPGSLSEPRQANRKPSYIVMNIEKDKKIDLNINYI